MIYVIGLGPGNPDQLTPRALSCLEKCDSVIGYKTYIDLIAPLFPKKNLIVSAMRKEVDRCREALRLSREGHTVGLISSGDPGVYGMAGIMLEVAAGSGEKVVIVPGITAACAASAVLGAPLTHDFAVISLSNLLTPMDLILRRLEAAAVADFVICLYNPMSRGRPDNLRIACKKLLEIKDPSTPAGWVRNAGRDGEEKGITTLGELKDMKLDMFCTVVIGNSDTTVLSDRLVTPRGYGREQ